MIHHRGLDLIKRFEGLRLEAYQCSANVWTIGYGHTRTAKPGMKITEDEAEKLLKMDIAKFAQAVRLRCIDATPLQHAAMTSLAFNIGVGAFNRSSVARLHNEGRFAEAGQAFALFNKVRGRVLSGLVKRRAAEAALYIEGTETDMEAVTPDPEKPLTASRTMAGSAVAGASMAGSALTEIQWIQDTIAPLTPYLPAIQAAFIGLGLLGVAVTMWARYRDRKEGRN